MNIHKLINIKDKLNITFTEVVLIYLLKERSKDYEKLINSTVSNRMQEKGYIKVIEDTTSLLYGNPTVSAVFTAIDKIDIGTFDKLIKEYRNLYRKYKGINGEGRIYEILGRLSEDKRAMALFIENNDIEFDVIIDATKMYLIENSDSSNIIKFAPRSDKFILGTDSKEYLLEFCHMLKRRRKKEEKIKESGNTHLEAYYES